MKMISIKANKSSSNTNNNLVDISNIKEMIKKQAKNVIKKLINNSNNKSEEFTAMVKLNSSDLAKILGVSFRTMSMAFNKKRDNKKITKEKEKAIENIKKKTEAARAKARKTGNLERAKEITKKGKEKIEKIEKKYKKIVEKWFKDKDKKKTSKTSEKKKEKPAASSSSKKEIPSKSKPKEEPKKEAPSKSVEKPKEEPKKATPEDFQKLKNVRKMFQASEEEAISMELNSKDIDKEFEHIGVKGIGKSIEDAGKQLADLYKSGEITDEKAAETLIKIMEDSKLLNKVDEAFSDSPDFERDEVKAQLGAVVSLMIMNKMVKNLK